MIALIVVSIWALISTCLLFVAIYRLIQWDRFGSFISTDIKEASVYLSSLAKREIFANSPEIMAAHNMFAELVRKLDRYTDVIQRSSFKATLNNESKPKDNRPVFMD